MGFAFTVGQEEFLGKRHLEDEMNIHISEAEKKSAWTWVFEEGYARIVHIPSVKTFLLIAPFFKIYLFLIASHETAC